MVVKKGDTILIPKGLESLPGMTDPVSFDRDVEGKVLSTDERRILVDVNGHYNILQYDPSSFGIKKVS